MPSRGQFGAEIGKKKKSNQKKPGCVESTLSLLLQLKSFHNELLTELEKKVELDARYLNVSLSKMSFCMLKARCDPPHLWFKLIRRQN